VSTLEMGSARPRDRASARTVRHSTAGRESSQHHGKLALEASQRCPGGVATHRSGAHAHVHRLFSLRVSFAISDDTRSIDANPLHEGVAGALMSVQCLSSPIRSCLPSRHHRRAARCRS
jgi:hypothetical protein